MHKQREFKSNQISRAVLEAETLSLGKLIENNKKQLINPYTTFYSALLMPACFYLLLTKSDLFKDIRETYQEEYTHDFWEKVSSVHVLTLPESKREIVTKMRELTRQRRDIINHFEKMLVEVLMLCPAPEPVIEILRQRDFPQADLYNYQSLVKSIPYKVYDLMEITDENHLLYYTAQFIDNLYLYTKDRGLINRYYNLYALFAGSAPPDLPLEKRLILTESKGWLSSITFNPETTCVQYARFIHVLTPYFLIQLDKEAMLAAPYALTRFGTQTLWLSISLSLFLNFILISPLLKKIIDTPGLMNYGFIKYFLPRRWYLDRPLTIKNYRFLETDVLVKEKKILSTAIIKQAPYVKISKLVDKLLTGFFLICCIFNLLFTVSWSDQTFAIIPILAGISLKNILSYSIEKYSVNRVAGRLQKLTAALESIFSPVSKLCLISSIKRDTEAMSYITIQILEKHETLPEKYLATVMKNTLNHFGVLISTHDAISISIAGTAHLHNTDVIKAFFPLVLKASIMHYQLSQQLKPMAQKISSHIIVEPFFLHPTQPSWSISAPSACSPLLPNLEGVTVDGRNMTIQRTTPFSNNDLNWLKMTLSSSEQKSDIRPEPILPAFKQKKPTAIAMRFSETTEPTQVPAPLTDRAVWSTAGVIFPGNPEVKPIVNALRRFMFFSLPLEAFGNDQEARDVFYSKSTQMARSKHDSQGIKHGHYLGTDFFTGKQIMYSSRIKVLGKHGNSGVLLSVEAADNGARLYQARSYATGIHA